MWIPECSGYPLPHTISVTGTFNFLVMWKNEIKRTTGRQEEEDEEETEKTKDFSPLAHQDN